MWKDRILSVIRDETFVRTAAAAVGVAAGFTAGYVVAKKRYFAQYNEILNQEIADAKALYSTLAKADPAQSSPEDLLESLGKSYQEQMETYEQMVEPYKPEPRKSPDGATLYVQDPDTYFDELDKEDPGDPMLPMNVFDTQEEATVTVMSDLSDVDKNIIDRSMRLKFEHKPYPITEEAFFADETGFPQLQLSWWEQNQILVDNQENQVYDSDAMVLLDNLAIFSELTSDGKTIYVRNEDREEEYEITLEEGDYRHEVEGFIEHGAARPGSRKSPRFDLEG